MLPLPGPQNPLHWLKWAPGVTPEPCGALAELLLTAHSMSACLGQSMSKNARLVGLCRCILLGIFVTAATCASEAAVAPGMSTQKICTVGPQQPARQRRILAPCLLSYYSHLFLASRRRRLGRERGKGRKEVTAHHKSICLQRAPVRGATLSS